MKSVLANAYVLKILFQCHSYRWEFLRGDQIMPTLTSLMDEPIDSFIMPWNYWEFVETFRGTSWLHKVWCWASLLFGVLSSFPSPCPSCSPSFSPPHSSPNLLAGRKWSCLSTCSHHHCATLPYITPASTGLRTIDWNHKANKSSFLSVGFTGVFAMMIK